jgi:hypothetical protein
LEVAFSAEEERLLKGALGCPLPEFIARFGAADAIKRVESELRRARRARSRKRVQSGSEPKSADRSIPPRGLRPTKALNSEGARFLLDRNLGQAALPVIAGEFLADVSADRATFGEQAKDLRNPAPSAAKSRMNCATDPKQRSGL